MTKPTDETITDRRIYRALRNYLHNEVFGQAAAEQGFAGWKAWLRKAVIEGSKDAYKGLSQQSIVETTIRREVGAVFDHWRKEGALTTKIEGEIPRQRQRN